MTPARSGVKNVSMLLLRKHVRAIQLVPRMVALLELLFERDCRVYAHELTIPMLTHRDAVKALFEARELLQDLRKGA